MNRIYLLVWNATTQTWAAVSENSRARGKPGKVVRAASAAVMAIAGAGAVGFTSTAHAAGAGLQLCDVTAKSGASMGTNPGPSVGLTCVAGSAFSLNNAGDNNGAAGFGAATARISGYADGTLELKGENGISMLNAVQMNGNKITQVATGAVGAASQDAINGSQLYATNQSVLANTTALSTLDGLVAQNMGDITNLTQSLNSGETGLVRQDATTKTITVARELDGAVVDLAGTAGARKLTGVDAGVVSAASQDAVNGSQLYATNQSVAANTSAITGLDGRVTTNTTSLSTLDGRVTTNASSISALDGRVTTNTTSISALDGRVTTNATSITELDGRVTQSMGDITNLTQSLNSGETGLVRQDATTKTITVARDSDGAVVDLAGTTGARKLTGVDAGVLSAASQDAVNGSQLYTTNQSVAANTSAITGLDGRVTTNTTSLSTLDGRVTTNTTSISALDGRVTTNASSITELNGRVTQSMGDITNLTQSLNSGETGLVRQDATTKTITVAQDSDGAVVDLAGTTGARKLTGVDAGVLSAASQDAVNGSQLYATNQSVAGNTSAISGLDGRVTTNTTAVSALDGRVTTNTTAVSALDGRVTTNTTAVSALDGRVTTNTGSISTLDGRVTQNTGDISNLAQSLNSGASGLVRQDATTKTITVAKDLDGAVVDLAGTTGARKLTGVDAGVLSAASQDAVNGSQLYATNQSVATNTSAITGLDGRVTTNTTAVSALDGRVTTNTGSISALDGRVTQNTGDISNLAQSLNSGASGLVRQDATTKTITVAKDLDGAVVDLAGTTGARKLTGVDAGDLSVASQDAVNGSQLYATNQSVATNTSAITGLDGRVTNNTTAVSALDGRVTTNTTAVSALDGRVTTNTASISTLDGRVTTNTTSISALDGRVTQNTGDISNLAQSLNSGASGLVRQDATTKTITVAKDLDGAVVDLSGTTGARKLTGIDAGVLSAASQDAVNGSQLYTTNQNLLANTTALSTLDGLVAQNTATLNTLTASIDNGGLGLVKQDAATRKLTVGQDQDGDLVDFAGTAGARQLTGVADGVVAPGSAYAVNGGQLYTASASAAGALGGGAIVNADGSISAPSYSVGGVTHHSVGSALTGLDNRVTQMQTTVDEVRQQTNNGEVGLVKQDAPTGAITVAADKGGNLVDMSGSDGARTVTGVANGAVSANSTEAVNGSQLYALSQQMNDMTTMGAAGIYVKVDGAGDGSDAAVVEAGTQGVAAGANASVTAANSVALGANSVADRANSVSVGTKGAERQVTNVAAGTQKTDAVNVGQLAPVVAGLGGGASIDETTGAVTGPSYVLDGQAYNNVGDALNSLDSNVQSNREGLNRLDSRLDQTNRAVADVARNAYSGIAATTALTMIPDVDQGKKFSLGMGAATYRGYQAIALGASARVNDRIKLKAGVGVGSGSATAGVGASLQW